MSRSSSQSTQQQVVSQSTSVTVQNVIEAPKQSALERFQTLAQVINTLDSKREMPAPTAVVVSNPDPLAALKDPQTLVWIGAAAIGLIVIAKRA